MWGTVEKSVIAVVWSNNKTSYDLKFPNFTGILSLFVDPVTHIPYKMQYFKQV